MKRKTSSFLLLLLFLFIPLCAEVDLGFDSDPIDIVEQENIVVQEDCIVFMVVNDRTVIDIFSESQELISMNISSDVPVDLLTNALHTMQFSEKMIEDNTVNYSKGYNHFHPLLL